MSKGGSERLAGNTVPRTERRNGDGSRARQKLTNY